MRVLVFASWYAGLYLGDTAGCVHAYAPALAVYNLSQLHLMNTYKEDNEQGQSSGLSYTLLGYKNCNSVPLLYKEATKVLFAGLRKAP